MQDAEREGLLRLIESHTVIDGRFTQIRRIGAAGGDGNFSMLFEAQDNQSGRRVALKFLRPNIPDPYRWASFRREEEVLHLLSGQRDIVQWAAPYSELSVSLRGPYGASVSIQFPYFGLELASGSNVGDIIAAGAMDIRECLVQFRAMVRGVQRLHRQQIVHRDLKPANFLVMLDGSIRLGDFGTARAFSGVALPIADRYQAPPGDRWYAAPEMMASLHDAMPQIAFHADIFALGAILFEVLSGIRLVTQVYTSELLETLMRDMVQVPKQNRKHVYDGIIGGIARKYPLPDVTNYGVPIPSCVSGRLNLLYKDLANLDYRIRLCDFPRIFRQIDICELILSNEAKYRRLLEQRRRRSATAMARRAERDILR